MAKATTALSPRESMIRLSRAWRPLFNDINSHYKVDAKGKVMLDRKTAEDLSIFSSLERKLKDAFLQQLLNDAKIIREEAKRKKDFGMAESLLREIEALLKSIKREELVRKRQARYLKSLASKLGGDVRRIESELRREEREARRDIERTFKAKERESLLSRAAKGDVKGKKEPEQLSLFK